MINSSIAKSIFLSLIVALSSCAAGYKAINTKSLEYADESNASSAGIEFAYQLDVFEASGNKRYAKREEKKNIRVVAIAITNNRSNPISFSNNLKLYASGKRIFLMEPEIVYGQIKQPAPVYLLWSLLWLRITKCDTNDCSNTYLPIGLPIAVGNMAVASGANQKLLTELKSNNLMHQEILPGETVFGLISFLDSGAVRLDLLVDD